MTIFYIANIRLPTEKAHGLQIMKMCEQFAGRADTELVVPRRFNPIKIDPFEYYGVNRSFEITRLPVLDLVKFGRFGFWLESLIFSKIAAIYLFLKKADVIYGRDEIPLYFLSFFKKNVFWEAHQGQINFAAHRLLKKAAGVITISEGLKSYYKNKRDDIFVSPDAVDANILNLDMSRLKCREKLSLPVDKKIVLYAGHLYDWKGVGALLEASRAFGDDFSFVFVGGTEEDVESYKSKVISQKLSNISFVGHRPHSEIPLWLKAADILILPNSAKAEISRSFTSPMKLFEYMASGTPIIASDLPSIREIVSEKEVLFFESDNANNLADQIKYAFQHEDEMRRKAEFAKQKVQNHTWASRAEKILFFVAQKRTEEKKSEFWPAILAGLGIAVLALPILKNLSLLDFIFSGGRKSAYFLIALWLVFVPAGSVFGIYLARLWARKKPAILQIARYGLIGWLNTFVYTGIFNWLSWLTGVASGLKADLLVFVAFAVTVTNSFFWNKYWVFESGGGSAKLEYAKFFGVTSFTALLNIFIFHLVVNTIGAPAGLDEKIWANVAILVQIPISFLGNFVGYKIFVFKKKNAIVD